MAGGNRPRVGLVLEPAGFEDPYNRGAYLGIERAVAELQIRGRVLTPSPREGCVPSLSLLARQRYDLVLATGAWAGGVSAAPAVDSVAVAFPGTTFAIIDVPHEALDHRPENVQGLTFSEQEAGYLAGFLAARMVTRGDGAGAISAVGGEPVPSVQRFIAGYQAGAASAGPEVAVLIGYTHDFLDPAKGKAVALSQIARGSRVVFQVASMCGLGALEAAREQDVWAIGVDGDQSSLGPHVLTSAVKRLDVAVFATIDEFDRGTLQTGGTSTFSLRNGAVGLGAFSAVVPEPVREELATVEAAIAAGSIAIPAGP